MKKLLTSLAAFTALTAAASAADLPRRAAPPVFAPVPVFTWTGFYAGFNAGYAFGVQDEPANTIVGTVDPRVLTFGSGLVAPNVTGFGDYALFAFRNQDSRDGFTGGGQIGYNYQFTPGSGVVVGIEADAQYVDFGRNRNAFASCFGTTLLNAFGPCGAAGVTSFGGINPGVTLVNPNGLNSLDYFGTVRGRLGYAFDRVLFYATGGFAYGGGGDGRNFGSSNGDDFKTGYAVGGGIEYALPTDSFLNFFRSSAVTLKMEGLYVNLDNNNRFANAFAFDAAGPIFAVQPGVSIPAANGAQSIILNGFRRETEFAMVRAGINYKFGSY